MWQGTGLVPLLPLLEDWLEDEEDDTTFRLLYSCSCREELILPDLLAELCSYWNFRLIVFLGGGEAPPGRLPNREVVLGRLGEEGVRGEVTGDSSFLLSGSKEYMQEVGARLQEQGVTVDRIHRF